jgi:hypothetical protein
MDDTSRIGLELANLCKVNPSMLTAKDRLSESWIQSDMKPSRGLIHGIA